MGLTCPRCNHRKRSDQFYKSRRECKECGAKYARKWYRTPRGRTTQAWNSILFRIKRSPAYKNVKVRISRKDFYEWALPMFQTWDSEKREGRPSIDRIDLYGHYELSNMRMISVTENCARNTRTRWHLAPEGTSWCGACKKYIHKEAFPRHKGSKTGVAGTCKACRRARYSPRTNPKAKKVFSPPNESWCSRCQTYLPIGKFYRKSKNGHGVQGDCKECQNALCLMRSRRRREQRQNK